MTVVSLLALFACGKENAKKESKEKVMAVLEKNCTNIYLSEWCAELEMLKFYKWNLLDLIWLNQHVGFLKYVPIDLDGKVHH